MGHAEIQRGVYLDPEALSRYAEDGTIITDDNQLLAFSQLRAGLEGSRTYELTVANRAILKQLTGREPFFSERKRRRNERGQAGGRRRRPAQ
jgi:hypothetical protein